MLLVLVFGVSASFASDAEDGIQATDESAETVSVTNTQNTTLTDRGSNELPENLGATNEESYSSSNNDVLAAGEGTFTELASEISKGGTITLSKNYKYDSSKDSAYINGTVINKAITINGNGRTIDGSSLARIFFINSSNVILKNINFINGHTDNLFGSTILIEGSYCSISDCSFKNGSTTTGGTLAIHGEYNSVKNCRFENNKAYHGSAIMWGYYSSTAIAEESHDGWVENCLFINNTCTGSCGAVNVHSPKFTIKDCNFTNNYAISMAGAIRIWKVADYSTIINCNFKNNNGTTGGAVNIDGADNVDMSDCTFIGNTGRTNGGAVQWTGINGVMKNCEFKNNNANYGGAALWSGTQGSISNCSFEHNSATFGGAMWVSGTYLTIDESSFDNNVATSDYYGGGAIGCPGAYATIANSTFTNNHADGVRTDNTQAGDGGAINILSSYAKIYGSTFINNTAADSGGAIHLGGIGSTVSNSTFINNINYGNVTAYKCGGGAIGTGDSANYASVSDCTFENNKATGTGLGGAIKVEKDYISVENCEFNDNSAVNGGAIYSFGNSVSIDNNEFNNNIATNDSGAVYLQDDTSASISSNTYNGNAAKTNNDIKTTNVDLLEDVLYISPNGKGTGTQTNPTNWTYAYSHIANGGTIYFTQGIYTDIVNQAIAKTLNLIGLGTVTIDLQQNGRAFTISSPNSLVKNINFKNGKINANGGALYITGDYVVVEECNFSDGYTITSGSNGGSGIYWGGSYGELKNSGFYNNNAQSGSGNGAVYWNGLYGTIDNCNFTNNKATGSDQSDAGAIWIGKTAILKNSYFEKNSGFNDGSTVILSGSVDNTQVLNCTFVNNNGNNGAYSRGTLSVWSGTNILIDGCKFISNNATNGGGIYWNPNGVGTISNCDFENNIASVNGGAVYTNANNILVLNSTFTGNKAINGSSIYSNPSKTISITNSSFTGNTATDEGTVYLGNNVKVTFENNEFASNTGGTISTVGEITSDLLFIRQGATGTGLIETDPTNWTYAVNHINNGGKIVFLQGIYSDLIKRLLFQFSKVIL